MMLYVCGRSGHCLGVSIEREMELKCHTYQVHLIKLSGTYMDGDLIRILGI